jgi:amino acid transporter
VVNKQATIQRNNIMSMTGLLLLLVPLFIMVLWVGVFSSNPAASQAEKQRIFLSYFPMFLRKPSSITLLSMAFTVSSIFFSIAGRKKANRLFSIVGIIAIAIASLLLLLLLFGML